ncbi:hypothetical protein F0562_007283 [Nyssa sinensis]|uniref:Transposase-associated domain-containing protein n=1 Tax=Nyssa sinensis TaxID=561372 RepID=A0A5J5A4Q9_9ASTE|nr:hypothetical protein F0562_007283 [Nyssa sinensis]
MDKSWMQLPSRDLPGYMKGIKDFIEYACPRTDKTNRIKCPCKKCNNRYYEPINTVKTHLELNGMDKTYTRWIFHGEDYDVLSDDDDDGGGPSEQHFDGLREMLANKQARRFDIDSKVQGETSSSHVPSVAGGDSQPFDDLSADSHLPLYPGCEKFSKLDFLVKLMNIKVIKGLSNKSIDMTLELMKMALPAGETLPKSYYESEKYLRDLGLANVPTHACKYDCALFWGEYKKEVKCPGCGELVRMYQEERGNEELQSQMQNHNLKIRTELESQVQAQGHSEVEAQVEAQVQVLVQAQLAEKLEAVEARERQMEVLINSSDTPSQEIIQPCKK